MKFHDYIEQSPEWQRERQHADNLRRKGMTQRATVNLPTNGVRDDNRPLVITITESHESAKCARSDTISERK